MDNCNFYRVFKSDEPMFDAIDGGITFECVVILRDIVTKNGYKLTKGQTFESVYFYFAIAEFAFCNWQEVPADSGHMFPDKTSLSIPQSELAPFLHWCESEEQYEKEKSEAHQEHVKTLEKYGLPDHTKIWK
jgi:hypothetical protein